MRSPPVLVAFVRVRAPCYELALGSVRARHASTPGRREASSGCGGVSCRCNSSVLVTNMVRRLCQAQNGGALWRGNWCGYAGGVCGCSSLVPVTNKKGRLCWGGKSCTSKAR